MRNILIGLGAVLLVLWIVVEVLYLLRSPWLYDGSALGDALQTHIVRGLLGLFGGGILALGLWQRPDSASASSASSPTAKPK
jgi:hypothetical protein